MYAFKSGKNSPIVSWRTVTNLPWVSVNTCLHAYTCCLYMYKNVLLSLDLKGNICYICAWAMKKIATPWGQILCGRVQVCAKRFLKFIWKFVRKFGTNLFSFHSVFSLFLPNCVNLRILNLPACEGYRLYSFQLYEKNGNSFNASTMVPIKSCLWINIPNKYCI